ncbi:MAG: hypothetical protein K6G69_04465 [Lachnospiraceae bacterium]|nr:hypothetical protein [Lachnospiraceae bacterium]
MNKVALQRLKTAYMYQKKAVTALFPESVGEHLDVIEKEVKDLIKEIVSEVITECCIHPRNADSDESKGNRGAKKVDIT